MKEKQLLDLAKEQFLYNEQLDVVEIEPRDLMAFAEGIVKLFAIPSVSGCFYNHKPTGIKGTLIKRYKPTGKPETILIDTFDNDVYFAPAHEFELVNNR